ncbi:GNAT family N-acetyltransferase [Shewanella sp. 10N.286.51.B7]|uniref:GNAT family N-acetyltransferase n=1 Tax=unclassified Shewanella TaxID=196818 RepID=UPI000C8522EE|nr:MULTISPECIES: GNAT family N-acetyltransferase [unclassified Shewanella]MCC4834864.1 GNAT family N-acetyltransferase [Shewanella sp. 10N.7]PMG78504.1 GNAT family N-acetyltransferase [Shewanella sp. 10N.286.51.B7]
MKVVPAEKEDLELFFSYLENQISENGCRENPLFQPISKYENELSKTSREKFKKGFDVSFGESGWRKLWLAKGQDGSIKGHIDLRNHSDENITHRVLLGMGVDSTCRKQGVGKKLIDTVVAFCHEAPAIDWLDLCVLSENTPAKNLYLKLGFTVVGEFQDQYRIDGQSISETAMVKGVKN